MHLSIIDSPTKILNKAFGKSIDKSAEMCYNIYIKKGDLKMEFYVVKSGDVPVIASYFDTLEEAKEYKKYLETYFQFYNFYIRTSEDVEVNGNLF